MRVDGDGCGGGPEALGLAQSQRLPHLGVGKAVGEEVAQGAETKAETTTICVMWGGVGWSQKHYYTVYEIDILVGGVNFTTLKFEVETK